MIFSVRTPIAGVAEAAQRAAAAEAAGFDQIWFGNDVLGTSGVVAVAAAAAVTSRIGLGVGVFEPVSMHPAQVAMIAAGLQELSGGRLLLGMGAGSEVFFGEIGLSRPAPVRRTSEAIVAVRALLRGESPAGVDGAGDGWTDRARLQRPPASVPPIYVGAMGPQMLAMAGRVADGALPLCLPPARFHRARTEIERGITAAGRPSSAVDLAACIWCSIDADHATARQRLAAFVTRYAGSLPVEALTEEGFDPGEFAHVHRVLVADGPEAAAAAVSADMLRLGLCGGPDEIVDQSRVLIAAGARHVSFGPPLGPEPDVAMAAIGRHVLPALRDEAPPHAAARDTSPTHVHPDALTGAVAAGFHPSGVRLGVVTLADLDRTCLDAVDDVVRGAGLDPARRVARLRPVPGAERVEDADVVAFLDRYGHEYALAVLPVGIDRGSTAVEEAARRAGCHVLRLESR